MLWEMEFLPTRTPIIRPISVEFSASKLIVGLEAPAKKIVKGKQR